MHYVVTAYRWGQRNAHSYVVGAFDNLESAKQCATAHVEYRGGKYGCEVMEAVGWKEDDAGDGQSTSQVFYVESPYFGLAGDAGHFHPADISKDRHPSRKPFTVRELQNQLWELERDRDKWKKRLEWLHTGSEKDADGCEWGVYRVKWNDAGQPVEVWQTNADLSDLDAEIRREHLNKPS